MFEANQTHVFKKNQVVVDGPRNTQSVGMSRFLKSEGRGGGVV